MTMSISRTREQFQQSKNLNITALVQDAGIIRLSEPGQGPFIDWCRGAFQFGDEDFFSDQPEEAETPEQEMQRYEQQRDRFFAQFPEENHVLKAHFEGAWNQMIVNALTGFEIPGNPNWFIDHSAIVAKLKPSENNGLRISIKHSPLKFKKFTNGVFEHLELGGELKISLVLIRDEKSGQDVFAIEKIRSSNPVIDDLIMGENIGPLAKASALEAMKVDENNCFDLKKISDCEKRIFAQLENSKISAMQRIALSATLTALNAILQKPKIEIEAENQYQESLKTLIHSAWGLCEEQPENTATTLETYFLTLTSLAQQAQAIDPSGTLNNVLYQHQREIAPQRALSLVNSLLLRAFSSDNQQYNLALKTVLTQTTEGNPKTDSEINQLSIKNPRGQLYEKLTHIEKALMLMKNSSRGKNNISNPTNAQNALKEAFSKVIELLYFNPNPLDSESNTMLASLSEFFDLGKVNCTNMASILENAQLSMKPTPVEKPKWWQFWRIEDRRKYEKFSLQKKLSAVAENPNLFLQEKLQRIQKITNEAMPHVFWKKAQREEYTRLQEKTRALCATEAFVHGEIAPTTFAAQMNKSGEKGKQLSFQFKKQLSRDIKNAEEYHQKFWNFRAEEHRELVKGEQASYGLSVDFKSLTHSPLSVVEEINHRVIAFNASLSSNQASFFAKRARTEKPLQVEKSIEKRLDEIIDAQTILSF